MPGSRRKAASSPGDAEPSTKRVKTESVIDGVTVQWEVEDRKNTWMSYPASQQGEITEGFNNKETQVALVDAKGDEVTVLFDKMMQKSKKTGWEKRIHCAVQEKEGTDFYTWQWKDDKNQWSFFGVDISVKLEKSFHSQDNTVSLTIANKSYTVDIKKMEQKNDDTGYSRKIARQISDATALPEPPPSVKAAIVAKPSGKRKTADNTENNVDETGDATPAGKKGRSGHSAVKQEKEAASAKPSTSKTVLLKGKAPVDPECVQKAGKAHVYYEGNDVYDCMLNQTNLSNNNNKYYLCQLLQDDGKKSYSVWFRWGRVGKKGQNSLFPCGPDLEEAKSIFCTKFHDKTKNEWSMRDKFQKVPGKYDLIKMDYNASDETDSGKKKLEKQEKVPPSKLDPRVQNLVNLICDIKTMEDAVLEMKYDAQKAPLGKITKEQIKAGYAALKKIDNCIQKEEFGRKLVEACDEFYTRVPHDFGMSRPPVIRTKAELKSKIQLLEALGDIEIAIKMLKEGDFSENPVDRHYHALHCKLKPLEQTHDDFKLVEQYLQNTHAATHSQYKMKLLDLFDCEKEGEAKNFRDVGNRKLLWHGSRMSNWAGILNQGLRIAPPEAPVTGYMFGKGIYFADMSSKSANYCYPTRSKNVGLVLLSEVALGTPNQLLAADYGADKLPAGKNSVQGLGRVAPDPKEEVTMSNGTVVPLGKPKDTGVKNPSGYTLNYNEFVVYDPRQVRMKYLCKVQFNF
ncbi:poly [ADP-ribose] polymerase 2-like [Lingula anatina]|uniref:Poly [ADP-ribose] polymerase n=1 Tax=Lingula anatina TaxID=7574 RepID=A0A1S3HEC1_LINAN|nr:poly [ADP-ribose] polymerase 2-like [Lingula anatina]|eukprot:XP_013383851.1 poly [ADP-ribose] polymerase 2-like [Lingula anatina]